MQSKRFRNQQFCVGDLVAPNWRPDKYYGTGIIFDVKFTGWNERGISVYWQGEGIGATKECSVDLVLLEQALD